MTAEYKAENLTVRDCFWGASECVQAPNVACESCIEREVEEYLKKHSNCYSGANNGEDE